MDSFEWNKIAGWVLAAGIALLGLSIVSGMVYAPHGHAEKGYVVEGVELEPGAGDAVAVEKPIAFYLAAADPAKGEAQFKKCAACHTITPGGANGIGPNNHGILGQDIAARPGFSYSSALKEKGGGWTWDAMNEWLKSPKAYAPGTKMAFAGISKPEDRANLLAYLNAQGSNLPLPPVPAEVASAAPATAADSPVAGTSGGKEATGAGKAPNVPIATEAQALKQPEGNIGGPGASAVTGTSKNDKN